MNKTLGQLLTMVILTPVLVTKGFTAELTETYGITKNEYSFDDSFLKGNARNVDLSTVLNGLAPGDYLVDVYINHNHVTRREISFRQQPDGKVYPCVTMENFIEWGGKAPRLKNGEENECPNLTTLIPGIEVKMNQQLLRLDIAIPQAYVDAKPRGYIPPVLWDGGIPALILNYAINGYHNKYAESTRESAYGNFTAGLNLGLFRVRHQSVWQWSNRDSSDYSSIRTYIQRAIPQIKSEMTAGETFTSGNIFDSVSFRGIRMATDERMRPDSLRGFAPVVRGLADTQAKVIVRQNGYVIYETSVSPGAFAINDLYSTGYGGDLHVEVQEADGRSKYFVVPYATVPGLLRPGQVNYDFSAGRLRQNDTGKLFYQLTASYGISNYATLHSGVQYMEHYAAAVAGSAINTPIGAISGDITFSRASLKGIEEAQKGTMTRLSYNKNLNSLGTNIALAAYRYTSSDFMSLSEAAGYNNQTSFLSSPRVINNRKDQFTLTLSQGLGDYGTMYFSGSMQNYRNNMATTKQAQVGYSNTYKDVNYSIDYMRSYESSGRKEDQIMLNFSLPLDKLNWNKAPHLSGGINKIIGGSLQENVSLSGLYGQDDSISWNTQANHTEGQGSGFSANAEKRFSGMAVQGGYSQGQNYRNVTAGVSGALVAYQNGVILSRHLGETIGIVEAKGARDATLSSYSDIKVNRFGHAVVPSLTPYRYNSIGLDPENMSANVELKSNSQRVVPYSGAVVKIKFDTVSGHSALLNAILPDGEALPFGSTVYDQQHNSVGIVGQGGMAYVRVASKKGTVTVRWGKENKDQCSIDYDFSTAAEEELIQVGGLQCQQNL